MALSKIAGLPANVELAYISAGDMSADVLGAAIQVGPLGRLRMEISWGSTGAPVGTLSLQALKLDRSVANTWADIPGSALEFSVQPNSNSASLLCYWTELQMFDQVRLKYTRTSGGTANTSLVAAYAVG